MPDLGQVKLCASFSPSANGDNKAPSSPHGPGGRAPCRRAAFRALLPAEAETAALSAQGPGAASGGLGLRTGPSSERKRRRKRGRRDGALRFRAPRPGGVGSVTPGRRHEPAPPGSSPAGGPGLTLPSGSPQRRCDPLEMSADHDSPRPEHPEKPPPCREQTQSPSHARGRPLPDPTAAQRGPHTLPSLPTWTPAWRAAGSGRPREPGPASEDSAVPSPSRTQRGHGPAAPGPALPPRPGGHPESQQRALSLRVCPGALPHRPLSPNTTHVFGLDRAIPSLWPMHVRSRSPSRPPARAATRLIASHSQQAAVGSWPFTEPDLNPLYWICTPRVNHRTPDVCSGVLCPSARPPASGAFLHLHPTSWPPLCSSASLHTRTQRWSPL